MSAAALPGADAPGHRRESQPWHHHRLLPGALPHGADRRILDVIRRTAPDIQVLQVSKNHDDEFESYEVTKRFLTEHPEADALFFAAAGLQGGCRAILAAGRQEHMRVICFDAETSVPAMVETGLICASISQQPRKQGSLPLELLFEYLTTGNPPEREIYYVDAAIKIRENI